MPAPKGTAGADRNRLAQLIEAPTRTRRLYPRNGFSGLEPNVLQVLIAADLHAGSTVGELVETLVLAQGTVSTAIARLKERGLVEATLDARDARRQPQRTTAAGRALIAEFLADVEMRGASVS